jgi:hypothetical protein
VSVMGCCPGKLILEKIWLRVGAKRAGLLGEVVYCPKHERPLGDVRSAPKPHWGPGRPLKPEEWLRVVETAPSAPFYVVQLADGRIVPEGWKEPTS